MPRCRRSYPRAAPFHKSDFQQGGTMATPAPPDRRCPAASHRTMVPSHFNATPAHLRTRAVQGRGPSARTRRRSSIPTMPRPLPTFSGGGWVPKRDASRLGSQSYGTSPIQGFAFLIAASSAGARSLGGSGHVRSYSPTGRRVRFRGSRCLERSRHSRPLNRLFWWSRWDWPHLRGLTGVCPWSLCA
jgi:hypothetical protein